MISGRDDIGSSTRAVIHWRPITRRITTVNIRARIITVIRYAGRGRDLPFALPPAPRPHNPVHVPADSRRMFAVVGMLAALVSRSTFVKLPVSDRQIDRKHPVR